MVAVNQAVPLITYGLAAPSHPGRDSETAGATTEAEGWEINPLQALEERWRLSLVGKMTLACCELLGVQT